MRRLYSTLGRLVWGFRSVEVGIRVLIQVAIRVRIMVVTRVVIRVEIMVAIRVV
jgi:hypothetical protein